MFPLYDRNRTRKAAYVTIGLISINALVFLYEMSLSSGGDEKKIDPFFKKYGVRPGSVINFLKGKEEVTVTKTKRYRYGPFGVVEKKHKEEIPLSFRLSLLPLLTSLFLHGGWGHLIGNMWFLWVFGDNIEDRLGHIRFLIFYILGGIAASLVHIAVTAGFANQASDLFRPTIGASGAVSAVLGAYLIAFPRAQIVTLLPIFFIFYVVQVPAAFFLLFWFIVQQLLPGLGNLGHAQGVAFWAHIGGFAAGVVYLWYLKSRQSPGPGRYVPYRHIR